MLRSILFFTLIFLFPGNFLQAKLDTMVSYWGFYAHRVINRQVIYLLPDKLFVFYKTHLEYIEQHAVDPDKRRYAVKGEAECHFIDLDRYCSRGQAPNEALPVYWDQAKDCFPEDSLRKHGIGPWNTYRVFLMLQKAFEQKDLKRILRHTADLGHYVGDMNVPLHTTQNYNGQLTGQDGIHGLWESSIPELSAKSYRFYQSKAQYIEKPAQFIWSMVANSNKNVLTVLQKEDSLSKIWSGQKSAYATRGKQLIKTYQTDFVSAYEKSLNGMVEGSLLQAIRSFSDLIFTAWVNAGQPDLGNLNSSKIPDNEVDTVVVLKNLEKIRSHE